QRIERRERRRERRILRDAVGVKLVIDPLLQPDLLDRGHLAGRDTPRQAVQRDDDSLLGIRLRRGGVQRLARHERAPHRHRYGQADNRGTSHRSLAALRLHLHCTPRAIRNTIASFSVRTPHDTLHISAGPIGYAHSDAASPTGGYKHSQAHHRFILWTNLKFRDSGKPFRGKPWKPVASANGERW